jgi:hypothetical protein
MAVIYGNLHVDEKYSKLFEPNLYYESVFVDGLTFTSKYEEKAGGIYVRKLSSTAVTPGAPGRDFTDVATSDTLIPIVLNNNFQKSNKIYNVQAENMEADVAREQFEVATKEVSEGWGQSALACLVTEAAQTASTDTTITTANLKKLILADRAKLVKAKAHPDVVMCSPDLFAILLETAGTQYTPVINDYANTNGQMGKWLGMTFIEANGLGATTATYYNAAGTLTTATFTKVEYVMYDHNAFSIVNNLEMARIVDSENFNGVKVQEEVNTGYKVTTGEAVLCKSMK